MRATLVASLLALVLGSPAFARPSSEPPTSSPPKKSRIVATALAIAGTAAPIALLAAADRSDGSARIAGAIVSVGGMLLLPSAGHWYAGKPGSIGMGIRSAGFAVALFALLPALGEDG